MVFFLAKVDQKKIFDEDSMSNELIDCYEGEKVSNFAGLLYSWRDYFSIYLVQPSLTTSSYFPFFFLFNSVQYNFIPTTKPHKHYSDTNFRQSDLNTSFCPPYL